MITTFVVLGTFSYNPKKDVGFTFYGVFTFFSLLTAAGGLRVLECLPFLVC